MTYKCFTCNSRFLKPDALLKHISSVHVGKKDPMVEKIKPGNLQNHEKPKEILELNHVHDITSNKLDQVHDEKELTRSPKSPTEHPPTKKSNEKFGNNLELKNQIDKFMCTFCPLELSSKQELNEHLPSHEKEFPLNFYKCEKCGKAFYEKVSLFHHNFTVHEGKKLFKCSMCETKYTTEHALTRHIDVVHEGKEPFKCPNCDVRFPTRELKLEHIELNHKKIHKEQVECEFCKKSFSKSFIWRHVGKNESCKSHYEKKRRKKNNEKKQISRKKKNHEANREFEDFKDKRECKFCKKKFSLSTILKHLSQNATCKSSYGNKYREIERKIIKERKQLAKEKNPENKKMIAKTIVDYPNSRMEIHETNIHEDSVDDLNDDALLKHITSVHVGKKDPIAMVENVKPGILQKDKKPKEILKLNHVHDITSDKLDQVYNEKELTRSPKSPIGFPLTKKSNEKFGNNLELKNQIDLVHEERKITKCLYCQKRFSRKYLRSHMMMCVHEKKKQDQEEIKLRKCFYCQNEFVPKILGSHMLTCNKKETIDLDMQIHVESKVSQGRSCAIPTCDYKSFRGGFFKFPIDPTIKSAWLKACNFSSANEHKATRICYQHFKVSDFSKKDIFAKDLRKMAQNGELGRLKKGTVPSRFLPENQSEFEITEDSIDKTDYTKDIFKNEMIQKQDSKIESTPSTKAVNVGLQVHEEKESPKLQMFQVIMLKVEDDFENEMENEYDIEFPGTKKKSQLLQQSPGDLCSTEKSCDIEMNLEPASTTKSLAPKISTAFQCKQCKAIFKEHYLLEKHFKSAHAVAKPDSNNSVQVETIEVCNIKADFKDETQKIVKFREKEMSVSNKLHGLPNQKLIGSIEQSESLPKQINNRKNQIKEQKETIQIGKYQLTKLKVANRKEDFHEDTKEEKNVDSGNMKENTPPLLTENVDKSPKLKSNDRENSKSLCGEVNNDSKVLKDFHNDPFAMTYPAKEVKSKIIPKVQVTDKLKSQKRHKKISNGRESPKLQMLKVCTLKVEDDVVNENSLPLLTENADKSPKIKSDNRRNSKFLCSEVNNDSKDLKKFHNDPSAMTYPVKKLKSKIVPEEQVHEKLKSQKRPKKLLPQRKEIDFSKYMSKELSKREAINSKDSSLTLFDVKVVDLNPIADSRISDLNPIVDPKIIDVNPIASSKIVGLNPIADAKVINVNPIIDPKIIDVNPMASSKIIHVKPIVDPIIIHPSDFFRSLKRQKLQNFNKRVRPNEINNKAEI